MGIRYLTFLLLAAAGAFAQNATQAGKFQGEPRLHRPAWLCRSILNLTPGTEYECRFVMTDPDGVTGQTTQVVKVRTRTEPKPYTGGRTLHVYPPDYFGPRQQPAFTGILQAYYGAGLGDWSVVWERRAQPGDTLLVHSGLYRPERLDYVDPMMAPFDGSMSLTLKGLSHL